MIIQVIRTPLDFGESLDAPVGRVNCWLPPAIEQDGIVPLVEELFGRRDELQRDAPERAAAYLDSLAGPLEALQRIGLQLQFATPDGGRETPCSGPRHGGGFPVQRVVTAVVRYVPSLLFGRHVHAPLDREVYRWPLNELSSRTAVVTGAAERQGSSRAAAGPFGGARRPAREPHGRASRHPRHHREAAKSPSAWTSRRR